MPSNRVTIYWYPNCSTCRKAVKWLDAAGIEHQRQDLVDTPPTAAQLADLHARSGQPLKKLFNTSGQSYRNGGFKEKLPSMSESEQIAALAADGKLIKRPILDAGHTVLVGFREATYSETLS